MKTAFIHARLPLFLNSTLARCLTIACLLGSTSAQAQNAYFQHNLVSDIPGLADFTDTNLVNPWGIAYGSASPFWVANDLSGTSTLYNSIGTPQSLVVNIPPPGASSLAKPTGIVFNGLTGFGGAHFIFDTEGGTIAAWTSGTNAVTKVDNSTNGAVYKGLAIGTSGGSNYLYAANFHAGTVEVYDTNFSHVILAGSFSDPTIPSGYAPFNVQNLNGLLYVAYALQDSAKSNDVAGAGHGYVSVFDTSGNFIKRFASTNVLNSPWGLCIAPTNFGAFSGALLVGNFGNGRINAFDFNSGTNLGTVMSISNTPIVNFGLWAIIPGNGGNGGDTRTIYFDAGIPGLGTNFLQTHGLFGAITAIAPTFTNTTDKGLAVGMSWVSGTPPFLLQKKVSLLDANWTDVLTSSNRLPLVPKEAQTEYFRVGGLATNTVLPFTVFMNAASEVPAVTNSSGTAVGTLSIEGTNLSYYISFSGLTGPATAAHLHAPADATTPANVMIGFNNVPSAPSGTISGTLQLTPDQVTNIVNGVCYANIHTSLNPNGEIRGQLTPLHIVVPMNAASEVPPVTNSTGSASASLTFVGSQLFYTLNYSGLAAPAIAAHIHGPADPTTTAPVIVPFTTPSGTSGSISGTATLTPTDMAYLLSGLTYVNIHTTTNSGGELRGQVWPLQFRVALNAASEVPSTSSSGSGSGLLTVVNNMLTYNFTFTNLLSAATAAHIHGPASPTGTANVIIPFSGVPAATSGTFSGTTTLTSQNLLYMISGLTYANIHTTNNPNGEIRGQVIPNN